MRNPTKPLVQPPSGLRADSVEVENEPVEGTLRADRVLLRSPRPRGDGSVVFDAVLAYADRPMRYKWGTEVATEQALSDPAYLKGLKGIGLYTTDTAVHKNGVLINVRADARAVGAVLDSRYDSDEKAVVIELVVNDAKTLDDIDARKIRDLSEAYVPMTRVRADGVIEQLRRRTNHVLICKAGRNPGAGLRADGSDGHEHQEDTQTQEGAMKLAAIVALLGAYGLRADSETELKADLDKLKTKGDDEAARAEAEKARADAAEGSLAAMRDTIGLTADAADVGERLDELVSEGIRADAEMLQVASEMGVKLPEASTPSTRVRDIFVALGGDESRADSAEYALAWIHGRRVAQPTAAQRHKRKAGTNTNPSGATSRRLY